MEDTNGVLFWVTVISLDKKVPFLKYGCSVNVSHNLDLYTSDEAGDCCDVILERSLESRMNYSYRPNIRTTHIVSFISIYCFGRYGASIKPSLGVTICYRNAFKLNYRYRTDQRIYHPTP